MAVQLTPHPVVYLQRHTDNFSQASAAARQNPVAPFQPHLFQSIVPRTTTSESTRDEQGGEVVSERFVSHASDPERGADAIDPQNHGRVVLRGNAFPAGHYGAVQGVVKIQPEQVQGS